MLRWYLLIFVLAIYSAFDAPIAFVFNVHYSSWHTWLDALISILYAIDIYAHFNGENKIEEEEILLDEKENSPYLKTIWFPIDLIATIPFAPVVGLMGGSPILHLLRLLRLLRLIRIIKIFKMMSTLSIFPTALKVPLVASIFAMLVNLIACGWVSFHPGPNVDIITVYNKAVYWTITTLTTIGYGDITPTTNVGRLFTMMVMILGVGVYSIIIGSVSKMFYMADKHKEAVKEKLNDLSLFMHYYDVPNDLQTQIYHYYNHVINKRLSANDKKIIADLPRALQSELEIYMNIKLISNVPVFHNCGLACLKEIAQSLKQDVFSPQQQVITKGEVGREMFIIGHGKLEVLNQNQEVIATLSKGQFFGEVALLEETTRNADVRSKSYCDLYKLTKENFMPILEKNPILEHNIQAILKKRASDVKMKDKKRS